MQRRLNLFILLAFFLVGCIDIENQETIDTQKPDITLIGENPFTLEYGKTYSEPGANAADNIDDDINVQITGTINSSILGEQVITYSATDTSGNSHTTTRVINIIDTTPPTILIQGVNPLTLEYGATYSEIGAIATDPVDGVLSVQTSGSIDTATLGEYIISYAASDISGNSVTATRVVTVIDYTPPLLEVIGANPMTVEYGSIYLDQGANAIDTVNGVINVQLSGSINTYSLSEQTVTYTATDASGNATTATRTINVTDTTAPIIEIQGDNPLTLEYGDTYLELGAAVIDADYAAESSYIPEDIISTFEDLFDLNNNTDIDITGAIDTSSLGVQTITYTATDPSGNSSSVDRTVNVVDTTSPAITLIGSENIIVYLDTTYAEGGASALDNYDGDITSSISISGTVNTSETGEYTVFYSVIDSSGNVVSVERSITVKELNYDFTFVDSDLRLYESSYEHIFDLNFDTTEEVSRTLDIDVSNLSTATEGVDFTLNTRQITVDSGDTQTSISLTIIDDSLLEYDESITLTFTAVNFEQDIEVLISDTTTATQSHTNLQNSFPSPMTSIIGNNLYVATTNKTEVYDLVTSKTTTSVTYSPSSGELFGDAITYNEESYMYGDGVLYKLNLSNYKYDFISQSPWFSSRTSEIQIVNDELYVVGGRTTFENSSVLVTVYNFETGQWRQPTPLNQKRYGAASAVVDDKLYIFGGNYSGDTSEIYDPISGKWSYITSNAMLGGSLDTATSHGDFIYIIISEVATNSTVLSYDTVNDLWIETTVNIPSRRYKDSFMYKGRIYIVGGNDNSGNDNSITSFYIGDD